MATYVESLPEMADITPENVNAVHMWEGTKLMKACRDGNVEEMKVLVEMGADVNIVNENLKPNNCTALLQAVHFAIDSATPEIGMLMVTYLLEKGAKAGPQPDTTPRSWAEERGKWAIAAVLLEAEHREGSVVADQYEAAKRRMKEKELCQMCQLGDLAQVKQFLAEADRHGTKIDMECLDASERYTPLCLAVAFMAADFRDICKLLVARGADVNWKDTTDVSVLQNSIDRVPASYCYNRAEEEDFATAKFLVESGAAVRWKDVEFALQKKRFPVAAYLIQKAAEKSKDEVAAWPWADARTQLFDEALQFTRDDQVDALKGYLAATANLGGASLSVNYEERGKTLLGIACEWTSVATVRCLLQEFGADANLTPSNGQAPIQQAASSSSGPDRVVAVLDVLLAAGAKVDVLVGGTKLRQHLEERKQPPFEVLNRLVAAECEQGLLSQGDAAALIAKFDAQIAAKAICDKINELLDAHRSVEYNYRKGTSKETYDSDVDDTPDLIALFEQADAAVGAAFDKDHLIGGISILQYAVFRGGRPGKLSTLAYLVDTRHCDVNFVSPGGKTTMYIAIENKDLDSVKFLLEHGYDAALKCEATDGLVAGEYAAQLADKSKDPADRDKLLSIAAALRAALPAEAA